MVSACGAEADLLDCRPCRIAAGVVTAGEWWKDAEILMLRHQLAVAQRERPRALARLTWPDRAWLALVAGTVPTERLAAMRLIVAPGTIVRWQRPTRQGSGSLSKPGTR
jgi:putative transposase